MKSILALPILFGIALCDGGLPSFTWDPVETTENGVPLLHVRFADGGPDDVILLERVNPIPVTDRETVAVNQCIFRGFLKNEKAPVALTGGCPFEDSFEMTIHSTRLNHFIVYMKDGVVHDHKSLYGMDFSGEMAYNDYLPAPQSTNMAQEIPISREQPARVVLKARLISDTSFRQRFGPDSVNKMREVMTHAQTFFDMDSLKTKVTVNIIDTAEINYAVTAADESLKSFTNHKDYGIDLYVYMCSENDSYGTVGLAWTGTVCNYDLNLRASVNEYLLTSAKTGHTVAHEIGHNLNMKHDFDVNTNGQSVARFDKSGKTCKDIGGVMDYDQKAYTGWSTCSNEDFAELYNKRAPGCLLAQGEAPPPCTDNEWYCASYKDTYCKPGYDSFYASCRKACGVCK